MLWQHSVSFILILCLQHRSQVCIHCVVPTGHHYDIICFHLKNQLWILTKVGKLDRKPTPIIQPTYWLLALSISCIVWAQGPVVLWKVMTILHCLTRACCRNFLRPDWEPPAICRISLENPLVPNWQERSWSVRGPETWINHFVWCILFYFQLMLRGVGGKLIKVCWPQLEE